MVCMECQANHFYRLIHIKFITIRSLLDFNYLSTLIAKATKLIVCVTLSVICEKLIKQYGVHGMPS
jgi:hypothetical protein